MRAFFMHYKKGEAVTQGSLFPVSLDELIPTDHSVRVIAAYVEHLSLSALGFTKAVTKATGRPPYDPADLLKLYLYGLLATHSLLAPSGSRVPTQCGCLVA